MNLCDLNLDDYLYSKAGLNISALGLPPPIAAAPESSKPILIWDIMQQIADGVNYIHSLGEVHRDLKPRNGADYFLKIC
jgi:serine/threonine protein kinase